MLSDSADVGLPGEVKSTGVERVYGGRQGLWGEEELLFNKHRGSVLKDEETSGDARW